MSADQEQEVPRSLTAEPWRLCHCGEAAIWHNWDEPFTRGLCRHCDEVRCDAFPGECGRSNRG